MSPFFDPNDILEARRDVEELMLDTCVIDRPGEPVTDQKTGAVLPAFAQVYKGKCKIQLMQAQSSTPEAGGAVFTVQGARLDIPVGAGPVETGDRVQILAAASSPALVGNAYRLVQLFEKTWQTAQRLRVEELV